MVFVKDVSKECLYTICGGIYANSHSFFFQGINNDISKKMHLLWFLSKSAAGQVTEMMTHATNLLFFVTVYQLYGLSKLY